MLTAYVLIHEVYVLRWCNDSIMYQIEMFYGAIPLVTAINRYWVRTSFSHRFGLLMLDFTIRTRIESHDLTRTFAHVTHTVE